MTVAKKTGPSRARYNMAPFKNDCGQKIRIKQCKIPKNTFENDSGQKKSDRSSARYKMAPLKK